MNPLAKETVNKLVEGIANLPYVLKVRAINKYPDNHWIEFQILHNYKTEFDYLFPYEIQEQIHDLVITAEWELRMQTAEKWYFDHNYQFSEFPIIEGHYWITPWTGWEEEFTDWIDAYNKASEYIHSDYQNIRTKHGYYLPEHLIDIRN